MAKLLTVKQAQAHPRYREVITEAVQRLKDSGSFSMDQVLIDTGYFELGSSFRWDFIRQIIEEEQATNLIPLASAFFRAHDPDAPADKYPERYMALGRGKKTVGYANGTESNGHFIVCRLRVNLKEARGKMKKGNERLEHGRRVGVEKLRSEGVRALPEPIAD